MATQQEREAFLRGWRAAMDEVLAVLQAEAADWAAEEHDAEQSGQYKLPGSFALEEVRSSFKGRHDLVAWISQNGPAAARQNDPELVRSLDTLIADSATNDDRVRLGLSPLPTSTVRPEAE